MVIFFEGNSNSEFVMALLTRSFASSIDLFPIPTICNDGRPCLESLSTSITLPSNPIGAAHRIFETIY